MVINMNCETFPQGTTEVNCPACDEKLDPSSGNSLRSHLVNRHSYSSHWCSLCPFVSGLPGDLVRHYQGTRSDRIVLLVFPITL